MDVGNTALFVLSAQGLSPARTFARELLSHDAQEPTFGLVAQHVACPASRRDRFCRYSNIGGVLPRPSEPRKRTTGS